MNGVGAELRPTVKSLEPQARATKTELTVKPMPIGMATVDVALSDTAILGRSTPTLTQNTVGNGKLPTVFK